MNDKQINKGKKLNKAIFADHIDYVILLIAKGKKRAQIMSDSKVLSWGLTRSSIDNYIRHAKNEIVNNSLQSRQEHLGRSILNLDYLYREALNRAGSEEGMQALRLCLDIQKEKNRLLKLRNL